MKRAVLEIDEERIGENVRKIYEFSKKKIIAVVKADAYGVGASLIAKILEPMKYVDSFAVACAEEGVKLRSEGIKKEILILGGVLKEEVPLIKEYGLVPVVSDDAHLEALKGHDIPFHVKYDTGMGRLGFLGKVIRDDRVAGVMSHLSSPANREFSLKQIREFEKIVELYGKLEKVHMESSAGLVYRVPFTTHVRVGLAIYGEKPLRDYPIDLKPALRLKARLISVKEVPEGFPISYGGTYRTKKRTRIGVVAFGYADGLMKSLSNKGYLLFKGKKLPILGNITMDMTIVELGDCDARVGDWVDIVNEERSFSALSRDAGTIPYEIMCNLSTRVERRVLRGGKRV
ncbi:MAG: alanine racemase [Aquificae bacterium]|nr:alanine racemase [Aquificota bacterium]